jgi:hypothetical protein
MEFNQRFSDAMYVARSVTDWDKPQFSWTKAYIASVFALAAYQHIPRYELRNAKRAKLIPCDWYQEFFKSQTSIATAQSLSKLGDASFSIIERKMVVVVLAKTQKTLFISLRGTQDFYDIFADFDIRKVYFPPDRRSLIQFHRGFFEAVASCLPEVVERVAEQMKDDIFLYITGHSLGGAMAAIMNAQLKDRFHWGCWRDQYYGMPISCYSFGMPRYGNRYAVSQLPYPYHIYNDKDMVPTFPPRFLGFADSLNEYCLTAGDKLLRPYEKGGGVFRFRGGKICLLGFAEHRIESYIERTNSAYKNGITDN